MRRVDLNSLNSEPLSHDTSSSKQVFIRNGTIPHLTQLAQVHIPPGTRLTPHAHSDMHEIFIVLSGQGRLHCEGATHAIEPGTCIQIAPGEVHAFENDDDGELVLVYFGVED